MADRQIPCWSRTRVYALLLAVAALCVLPVAARAGDRNVTQTPQPLAANHVHVVTDPGEAALSPEELGDLYMARRRYQAALETYPRAPLSATIWNKIGIAQQQLYLMNDAKKSYETSLKLNPANPDTLNNLGTVYYSMKQYGASEKFYKKALKLKPRSALIYKNLGTSLLAANKYKKGWDCYQTALSIDPEIFEKASLLRIGEPTPPQKRGAMSYYLAKSYVAVGQNDLAVEYLRRAIDDGFTDRKKILADKEFASLHGLNSFEQLLAEQQRRQ